MRLSRRMQMPSLPVTLPPRSTLPARLWAFARAVMTDRQSVRAPLSAATLLTILFMLAASRLSPAYADPPPPPDLSITKHHAGSFSVGSTSAVYTFVVSNAPSTGPTIDTIQITDLLPNGMTFNSIDGQANGWECSGTNIVDCRNGDVIP